MSLDRRDPVLRRGTVLLTALMITPDDELDEFGRVRVDGLERLALERARGILEGVLFSLLDPRPNNLARLDDAWEALKRVKAPSSVEPSSPRPAPAPPVEPAAHEPAVVPEPPRQAPRRSEVPPVAPAASPWGSTAPRPPAPVASSPPAPVAVPFSILPMSLDQYAALVARTEGMAPRDARTIEAELGIRDEAQRREVDAAFRRVFAADPTKAERYEEHLQRCRHWRQQEELAVAIVSPGAGVDATSFMAPIELADPVPFRGNAVAPPSAVEEEPHPAIGSTGLLDLDAVAAIATNVFAPANKESELALPLDRYAVVVLLTENADEARRAQVHREYGIADEAARRKLDQDVGRALRKDAKLRETLQQYLEQWKRLKDR
ncbi:MAG: hypothetical protein R3B72_40605 [Polyangiaceae bacterium]